MRCRMLSIDVVWFGKSRLPYLWPLVGVIVKLVE